MLADFECQRHVYCAKFASFLHSIACFYQHGVASSVAIDVQICIRVLPFVLMFAVSIMLIHPEFEVYQVYDDTDI